MKTETLKTNQNNRKDEKMKLTPKEHEVLKAIAENEFHDGLKGPDIIGSNIWSDCIYCSIEGKALSGVVSSLAKKGLVRASGANTICITKERYEIYKNSK